VAAPRLELMGKLIYANGQPVHHRTWFKVLFNPALRRVGLVIVSCLDNQNCVCGYRLRRYPFKDHAPSHPQ
jgi:hypothetical protein